ncbi:MAG: hypothetical protein ACI30K_01590 [Muribaculaceae bacterium]
MTDKIHISIARRMLESGEPVSLDVWKSDGTVMHIDRCISLRYDMHTGVRNVKIRPSGQIRRVRDCCIFRINNNEVYL